MDVLSMPLPRPSATLTPTSNASASLMMSGPKLRLMCSYGGHIVPRPHDKSLTYAGGDTRIIAVDRSTATLSSLASHLAAALLLHPPFVLKYQLPGHDLDSLVSIATDEDFDNMLDEYDRLAASPYSSRLRIFLFPSKNEPSPSILDDSGSESWFLDALRGAKIGAKERFPDHGAENGDPEPNPTKVSAHGFGNHGMCPGSAAAAESIVLETSSSFGSSASSISMLSLPPIRAHVEDTNTIKLPASDSIESDKSAGSVFTPPQAGISQDIIVSRVVSNPLDLESTVCYPPAGISVQQTAQVSGYPRAPQMHPQQPQQQHQQMQFVPAGAHYISPYPPPVVTPVSSYYPIYHPPLQQQQPQQFSNQSNSNQPYPFYILPVGQAQAYNVPIRGNLIGATPVASSQLQVIPNASMAPSSVGHKEVTAASPQMPVLLSNVCREAPEANLHAHVPSDRSQQLYVFSPQMHHPSRSASPIPVITDNYSNDFDDDPALAQIYKSQPPVPIQQQTKSGKDSLSESLIDTAAHGQY